MKSLRKAIFASLLALGICQAHAEDGVTDSSITLGMSAPFTGPNGLYGMLMREAMTAYFDQVNKGGGVNGRKIRVISEDDGYVVTRAVQAAFGFDAATWYRLARNSFEASFATDAERAGWIARLDAYFAAAGVPPG